MKTQTPDEPLPLLSRSEFLTQLETVRFALLNFRCWAFKALVYALLGLCSVRNAISETTTTIPLLPSWSHSEIGSTVGQPNGGHSSGTISMVGGQTSGVSDRLYFRHISVREGSRIDLNLTGNPTTGLSGAMVRDSLRPEAPFVSIAKNSSGELILRCRRRAGAVPETVNLGIQAQWSWMRLEVGRSAVYVSAAASNYSTVSGHDVWSLLRCFEVDLLADGDVGGAFTESSQVSIPSLHFSNPTLWSEKEAVVAVPGSIEVSGQWVASSSADAVGGDSLSHEGGTGDWVDFSLFPKVAGTYQIWVHCPDLEIGALEVTVAGGQIITTSPVEGTGWRLVGNSSLSAAGPESPVKVRVRSNSGARSAVSSVRAVFQEPKSWAPVGWQEQGSNRIDPISNNSIFSGLKKVKASANDSNYDNWNGGGYGAYPLLGDFCFQFTVPDNIWHLKVGVSNGVGDSSHSSILYRFNFDGADRRVFANGGGSSTEYAFASSTWFAIERLGGHVQFRINGTVIHQASAPISSPLYLDSSLKTLNARFINSRTVGWRITAGSQFDVDNDLSPDSEELLVINADSEDQIQSPWDILMSGDEDGDFLSNREEVLPPPGRFASNPTRSDTDGDGLSDYEESVTYGTRPDRRDTDRDGLTDFLEVHSPYGFIAHDMDGDSDNDGVSDLTEWEILSFIEDEDPEVDSFRTQQDVTASLDQDFDGDGVANIHESQDRTSAVNKDDYFRPIEFGRLFGDHVGADKSETQIQPQIFATRLKRNVQTGSASGGISHHEVYNGTRVRFQISSMDSEFSAEQAVVGFSHRNVISGSLAGHDPDYGVTLKRRQDGSVEARFRVHDDIYDDPSVVFSESDLVELSLVIEDGNWKMRVADALDASRSASVDLPSEFANIDLDEHPLAVAVALHAPEVMIHNGRYRLVHDPDRDNDFIADRWEIEHGLDPNDPDDADDDIDLNDENLIVGDGLTNLEEYRLDTNPHSRHSDDDLMPDGWEFENQLNPLVDDSLDDSDSDGLKNYAEFLAQTFANDSDSDDDGLKDGWEVTYGFNPRSPPGEGEDSVDLDGDGLTNVQEFAGGSDPRDFFNGVLPVLTIVSGDGQVAPASQWLSDPIVIRVSHGSTGAALQNAPMSLTLTSGAGLLAFEKVPSSGSAHLEGRTNASGVMVFYHYQAPVDGVVSQITVQASSVSTTVTSESGTPNSFPNELSVVPILPASGGGVSRSVGPAGLEAGDGYGSSVAASGEWMAVGATGDDDESSDSGAVYLFKQVEGRWEEDQKISVPGLGVGANFGDALAIDGLNLLVGCPNRASVFVFRFDGASWTHTDTVSSTDHAGRFGQSVDISGDQFVVGAFREFQNGSNAGAAFLFSLSNGQATEILRIAPGGPHAWFGKSVAIHGGTIVVGAPTDIEYRNSGVVHYNEEDDGSGGTVLVGYEMPTPRVHVYEFLSGVVTQVHEAVPPTIHGDWFGEKVDIEGSIIVVGDRGVGGINVDGGTLGGSMVGYVHVIERANPSAEWELSGTIAPDDRNPLTFGSTVGVFDGRISVGAPKQHESSYQVFHPENGWEPGAVPEYGGNLVTYRRIGGEWERDELLGSSLPRELSAEIGTVSAVHPLGQVSGTPLLGGGGILEFPSVLPGLGRASLQDAILGEVVGFDPDGDPLEFSVVGEHVGTFVIREEAGSFFLRVDDPDFLGAFDGESITIRLRVEDSRGGWMEREFLFRMVSGANPITLNGGGEPIAPTNLKLTEISGDRLKLRWVDNAANEDGYSIEQSVDGGNSFVVLAQTGRSENVFQFDRPSVNGNLLRYQVRGFNENGNSGYSNQAALVILTPPAPEDLSISESPNGGAGWIVSWQTGAGVVGYEIFRRLSLGGQEWELIGSFGGSVGAMVDEFIATLPSGVVADYRVRAFNDHGYSNWSATATMSTSPLPPSRPTKFRSKWNASEALRLTWVDNANNEDGFRIEKFNQALGEFVSLATVGAGVTTYVDSDNVPGIAARYRIHAFRNDGLRSGYNWLMTATVPESDGLISTRNSKDIDSDFDGLSNLLEDLQGSDSNGTPGGHLYEMPAGFKPHSINAFGVCSGVLDNGRVAVWDHGQITELPNGDIGLSAKTWINDKGDVAAAIPGLRAPGSSRLWLAGEFVELESVGSNVEILQLHETGLIHGYFYDGELKPFVRHVSGDVKRFEPPFPLGPNSLWVTHTPLFESVVVLTNGQLFYTPKSDGTWNVYDPADGIHPLPGGASTLLYEIHSFGKHQHLSGKMTAGSNQYAFTYYVGGELMLYGTDPRGRFLYSFQGPFGQFDPYPDPVGSPYSRIGYSPAINAFSQVSYFPMDGGEGVILDPNPDESGFPNAVLGGTPFGDLQGWDQSTIILNRSLATDSGFFAAEIVDQTYVEGETGKVSISFLGEDFFSSDWSNQSGELWGVVDLDETGQGILSVLGNDLSWRILKPFQDGDSDGISDAWERFYGLNPAFSNRDSDTDGDGISDLSEFRRNLNPTAKDSDEDGLDDSDPLDPDPERSDFDGDGMLDGYEAMFPEVLNPRVPDAGEDPDEDSFTNLEEMDGGTFPDRFDSNNDLVHDGFEGRFFGWFAADEGVTIGPDGTLQQWEDLSGRGSEFMSTYDFTTPALNPAFEEERASVGFSGDDGFTIQGTSWLHHDGFGLSTVIELGDNLRSEYQEVTLFELANSLRFTLEKGELFAIVSLRGRASEKRRLHFRPIAGRSFVASIDYDPVLLTLRAFVNGNLVYESESADPIPIPGDFRVGASESGPGFVGRISEIIIYEGIPERVNRSVARERQINSIIEFLLGKYQIDTVVNPRIEILNPDGGDLGVGPLELTIEVDATPSPGAEIERVEYTNNGHTIGVSSEAPFSLSDLNLAAGLHALRADVYDSSGRRAMSDVVMCRIRRTPTAGEGGGNEGANPKENEVFTGMSPSGSINPADTDDLQSVPNLSSSKKDHKRDTRPAYFPPVTGLTVDFPNVSELGQCAWGDVFTGQKNYSKVKVSWNSYSQPSSAVLVMQSTNGGGYEVVEKSSFNNSLFIPVYVGNTYKFAVQVVPDPDPFAPPGADPELQLPGPSEPVFSQNIEVPISVGSIVVKGSYSQSSNPPCSPDLVPYPEPDVNSNPGPDPNPEPTPDPNPDPNPEPTPDPDPSPPVHPCFTYLDGRGVPLSDVTSTLSFQNIVSSLEMVRDNDEECPDGRRTHRHWDKVSRSTGVFVINGFVAPQSEATVDCEIVVEERQYNTDLNLWRGWTTRRREARTVPIAIGDLNASVSENLDVLEGLTPQTNREIKVSLIVKGFNAPKRLDPSDGFTPEGGGGGGEPGGPGGNQLNWTSLSVGQRTGPSGNLVGFDGSIQDHTVGFDPLSLSLVYEEKDVVENNGSSLLNLGASRIATEEIWSSKHGLKPHERLDLPFGPGWSSSLLGYIQFTEVKNYRDGTWIDVGGGAEVRVAGGRQLRFTRTEEKYVPSVESIHQRDELKSSLKEIDDLPVGSSKRMLFSTHDGFWAEFEAIATEQTILSDRMATAENVDSIVVYTYSRIVGAGDRLGNEVTYEYSDASLIPDRIVDSNGLAIYIKHDESGKITDIWDGDGERTRFNYVGGGPVGTSVLDEVIHSNGLRTSYSYDLQTDQSQDPPQAKSPGVNQIYHFSLDRIDNGRGLNVEFSYAFNRGRRVWREGTVIVDDELQKTESLVIETGIRRWVDRVVFSNGTEAIFHRIEDSHYGKYDGTGPSNFHSAVTTTLTGRDGIARTLRFRDPINAVIKLPAIPNSNSKSLYVETSFRRFEIDQGRGFPSDATFIFDERACLAPTEIVNPIGGRRVMAYREKWGAASGFGNTFEGVTLYYPLPTFARNEVGEVIRTKYQTQFKIPHTVLDHRGTVKNYEIHPTFGRVESVTTRDSVGVVRELIEYDFHPVSAGFVTRKTSVALGGDQSGADDLVIEYVPDSQGRILDEIVDPEGKRLITSRYYNWKGDLVEVVDPKGNASEIQRGPRGRIDRIIRPTGEERFVYDMPNHKITRIDREGVNTFLVYHPEFGALQRRTIDLNGNGIADQRGVDYVTEWEFNDWGDVTAVVDSYGRRTETPRDDLGFVERIDRVGDDGSRLSIKLDHLFHGDGRVDEIITDMRGFDEIASYDAAGRLVQHRREFAPGRFAQSSTQFLLKEGLIKHWNNAGELTTEKLDIFGRVEESALPGGIVFGRKYTSTGLVWKEWRRVGLHESVWQNWFDTAGRTIATEGPAFDQAGGRRDRPSTDFTLDRNGDVERTTELLSWDALTGEFQAAISDFIYDEDGRLETIISPEVFDAETAVNARPQVHWEEILVPTYISVVNSEGAFVQVLSTRRVEYHDSRGRVSSSYFDALGRLVQSVGVAVPVFGSQVPVSPVTRYFYDPEDGSETVSDPRGSLTTKRYDSFGRVSEIVAPLGVRAIYDYLPDQGIHSITDGKGQRITYQADGLGRTTSIHIQGDVEATRFEYDEAYLRKMIFPNGDEVTYVSYDSRGRLTERVHGHSSVTRFEYDDENRRVEITVDGHTLKRVVRRYNEGGSLVEEESSGVTHELEYDLGGRLKSLIYGRSQRAIHFEHDALGRNITISEGGRTTYHHFDLNGNLLAKGLPNGQFVVNEYDDAGRLSGTTAWKSDQQTSGEVVYDLSYGYDEKGNRRYVREELEAGLFERVLGYDEVNRLKTEVIEGPGLDRSVEYWYDAAGNRTRSLVSENSNPPADTEFVYSTEKYNQLDEVRGPPGGTSTSYSYDANGNRKSCSHGSEFVQMYHYDGLNRLQSVDAGGNPLVSYSYDAVGRRVHRVEEQDSRRFSFAGEIPVQEYSGEVGSPDREYVHGLGLGGGIGSVVYAISATSGVDGYRHYNVRGDLVAIANSTGNTAYEQLYGAFGDRLLVSAGTVREGNNSRFLNAAGLLEEGFRFRDPLIGAYTSRDPIGAAGGMNLYAYVDGNPWSFVDPFGLQAQETKADVEGKIHGDGINRGESGGGSAPSPPLPGGGANPSNGNHSETAGSEFGILGEAFAESRRRQAEALHRQQVLDRMWAFHEKSRIHPINESLGGEEPNPLEATASDPIEEAAPALWHYGGSRVEGFEGGQVVDEDGSSMSESGNSFVDNSVDSWDNDKYITDVENQEGEIRRGLAEGAAASFEVAPSGKLVSGGWKLAGKVRNVFKRGGDDVLRGSRAAKTTPWTQVSSDARAILRDVEGRTGMTIPSNQRSLLAGQVRAVDHRIPVSDAQYKALQAEYRSSRPSMIADWEANTGQVWPSGAQAHHIIPTRYGGPNQWWNIHPAQGSVHQGGIHGVGSPTQSVFPTPVPR